MAATTVTMPQLGESVVEGTIVKWLAQPGQRIEVDQPLVEIATDKANTEVPSPSAGVLIEVIAQEGAVVQVGGPLARLDDAAAASGQAGAAAARAGRPAAGAGRATASSAGVRFRTGRSAAGAARRQRAPARQPRGPQR